MIEEEPLCEVCGNLAEDCECELDEDYGPQFDDILETGYDGDAI